MELQDFVTPELIAGLVAAFLAVFTAFAAYGATAAKLYLKTKTSKNQWDFILSQAATAVKHMEQSPVWTGEEGAKKKQAVVIYLSQLADEAKIPMTPELLDRIVEAAVHDIKKRTGDLIEMQGLSIDAALPG